VPLEGTAKKAKELTFKPTKTPHYCGAILKGTRFGLVRWKPTEKDETFTTALKGGYVATVWKNDVRQIFKTGEPRGADSDISNQHRQRLS
jgi:hypothetical protein